MVCGSIHIQISPSASEQHTVMQVRVLKLYYINLVLLMSSNSTHNFSGICLQNNQIMLYVVLTSCDPLILPHLVHKISSNYRNFAD